MGMEVLGLSCISNMAAGMQAAALSAEEVIATTARVQGDFIRLLEAIIGRL
jgi:purine-nucleoside phosphorylase